MSLMNDLLSSFNLIVIYSSPLENDVNRNLTNSEPNASLWAHEKIQESTFLNGCSGDLCASPTLSSLFGLK